MNEEIIGEDLVVEEDLRMDPEFEKELMATFILELSELLTIYRNSLGEIRSVMGDKSKAYKELFRVYHTLKGDAGYFEEFAEFTKFASYHCETLRHADEKIWNNPKILQTMSINYSLISTAYHALSNGRNLQALRFKIKVEVIDPPEPIEKEVNIDAEVPMEEEVEINIDLPIDDIEQIDFGVSQENNDLPVMKDQFIDQESVEDESQIDTEMQIEDEEPSESEDVVNFEDQIAHEMQIEDEEPSDSEDLTEEHGDDEIQKDFEEQLDS